MKKQAIITFLLLISLVACSNAQQDGSNALSSASNTGQGIVQAHKKAPNINLITGKPLTPQQTAGTRPVAVMISNNEQAYPQRGIAAADAIFEIETEGGITRLMALYADATQIPQVGPVRSARDQHLQFALPLNAVFTHIGSSVYAQNLLNQYHYQDIDGLYLGTNAFVFDEKRAQTHPQEQCWYTDAALLQAGIQQTGILTQGAHEPLFSFHSSVKLPTGGNAESIAFFASPTTEITLQYNPSTQTYLKTAYGKPHIDEQTGTQLSFENVLLLFDTVTTKPDGLLTNFDIVSGDGYYFYGGKYQKIKWKKEDVTTPIVLTDEAGKPFSINQGKSYISVIRKELAEKLNITPAPASS